MRKIEFIKVADDQLAEVVERLAFKIWKNYYTAMIGKDTVEYILNKFQTKKAILKQIEKEKFLYYLIKDQNNDWAGYFGIIPKDNELFISKFYIDIENRKKGYGRQVIKFIEKTARNNKIPKISLNVHKKNFPSIDIYKKIGFTITDSVIIDIGNGFVMDDYKMEKIIGNAVC